MANPFDQFDAPVKNNTATSNPFDQFDNPGAAGEPSPHQIYTSEGIPVGDPVHIPRDAPVTEETKPTLPVSNLRGKQEDTTLLDDFINFIKPNKNLVNEVDQFTDQLQGGKQLKELGIGLVEGGNEIIRTLNTAIDKATGGRTDFSGAAERTLPNFPEPEGIANTIARSVGQWAPGMAVGGGAMQSLLAGSKLAPLAKTVLTSMAADAGGGFLSANPNDQPLILGDKSMLSSYTGWGVNPETGVVEDKDLFAKKLTLAMDATLTGLGVNAVFGLLGKVFGDFVVGPQLKSIARMGNKSMQEDAVMRGVIEALGQDVNDPQAIERILQVVSSNSDAVVKFSDNSAELVDIAYKQPTFRIFINQWAEEAAQSNPKIAAQLRSEIAKFNNAVNSHAGPALETAMDAPVAAITKTTDQMVEGVGKGIDNIQSAGPRIEKAFQENVIEPKKAELATREAQLQGADKLIEDAIKNDPTFGPLLEKSVSIKTNDGARKTLKEISQNFLSVVDAVRQRKNELYAMRPKGLKGNLDLVISKAQEINNRAGGDLIPQNFLEKVMATGGDIEKLENLSNFNLNDMITSNVKAGNYSVADALRELRKSMTTDQLDDVIKRYNTFQEAASNPWNALDPVEELNPQIMKSPEALWALEAKKFYQEEFLPLKNHPTVGKIMDMQIDRIGVEDIDVGPNTRKLIDTDVSNVSENPERVLGDEVNPGLSDLYTRYVTNGNNEEPFKKYGLLRVAERISDEISVKGKLEAKDILRYQQEFKKIQPLLSETDQARVEELLTKIRDTAVFEKPDLERIVAGLRDELKGLEDDIYGTVLEPFFQKNGSLRGNSYASLKQMFSKEGNEANLKRILDVVEQSGDMEAKRAIQGAYGKYLKDSFFTASDRPSGVSSVSIEKLGEFLDETSSMANYAKQLYGDDFYNNMRLIVKDAKDNFGVVGRKQNEISSSTAVQTLGAQSVNSVITWFLGVLNPTAARVRTITGYYLKNNPTAPQMKEIIDGLLANPDYFVEVANRVKKQGSSAKTKKEVSRYVRSLLTKSAIYGPQENEQFNPTDEQTNEVFNANQMEQSNEEK